MSQIFCLHKSHMAIPITDNTAAADHRLIFCLCTNQSLKKSTITSHRKRIFQKFIFVSAPSFILFQSLFELKMKFFKIVLFHQRSGVGGLPYTSQIICIFRQYSLKLSLPVPPIPPQGWLVVVVRRKVL